MSRLKSVKEMSLKKKIILFVIIIAIVVASVFLIIKFGFPDADVNKPYELAHEITSDQENDNKINECFNFFVTNGNESQKNDVANLKDLGKYYLARLSVDKIENHNFESLLYSLNSLKDKDKLNKKIKQLTKLKESVDNSKNTLLQYCESQVLQYKASTSEYSQISLYYDNFTVKYVNYLKEIREIENYLIEIINTNADENSYNNSLTRFARDFNNKYLSNCLDKCIKKFEKNEEQSLAGLPVYSTETNPTKPLLEIKADAITNYLNDFSSDNKTINEIQSLDLLNNVIANLHITSETEFLTDLTDAQKQDYNKIKTFIAKYFDSDNLLIVEAE